MASYDKSDGIDDRRTSSLAGIVVVLVLLVVSSVIIRKLQVRVLLEVCMQTQRPACETTIDRLRVSRLLERFAGQ